MSDKQHKGLDSAQKPQTKWKPDADKLRVETIHPSMERRFKVKQRVKNQKGSKQPTRDTMKNPTIWADLTLTKLPGEVWCMYGASDEEARETSRLSIN